MLYSSASGNRIYNEGETQIQGVIDEGFPMNMKMQVGDVTNVLGSIKKTCRTGNRVIFDDDDGNYIENKKDGGKTNSQEKMECVSSTSG